MTNSLERNQRQIRLSFRLHFFRKIGFGFAILLLALPAKAEVLDKLEFPWENAHYVRMTIALGFTIGLAASKHLSLRLAGLVTAIVWTTISLWTDPWFTPDLGGALRAELTNEQSSRWLRTILIQALLPLILTLTVFLVRTLTPVFHQTKR
jgi:hypothetical protein